PPKIVLADRWKRLLWPIDGVAVATGHSPEDLATSSNERLRFTLNPRSPGMFSQLVSVYLRNALPATTPLKNACMKIRKKTPTDLPNGQAGRILPSSARF